MPSTFICPEELDTASSIISGNQCVPQSLFSSESKSHSSWSVYVIDVKPSLTRTQFCLESCFHQMATCTPGCSPILLLWEGVFYYSPAKAELWEVQLSVFGGFWHSLWCSSTADSFYQIWSFSPEKKAASQALLLSAEYLLSRTVKFQIRGINCARFLSEILHFLSLLLAVMFT